MLLIKGLNKDLLQRTLYNLREVCGERTILSESSMTPCQFSKSTDQPRAVSGYAKVWSGQTIPGEGNEDMMDVCIKVIKSEKILEVSESSHCSPGTTRRTVSLRNSMGTLHYGRSWIIQTSLDASA